MCVSNTLNCFVRIANREKGHERRKAETKISRRFALTSAVLLSNLEDQPCGIISAHQVMRYHRTKVAACKWIRCLLYVAAPNIAIPVVIYHQKTFDRSSVLCEICPLFFLLLLRFFFFSLPTSDLIDLQTMLI